MGRIRFGLLACVIILLIGLGSWLTIQMHWPTHLVAVVLFLVIVVGAAVGILLRAPD